MKKSPLITTSIFLLLFCACKQQPNINFEGAPDRFKYHNTTNQVVNLFFNGTQRSCKPGNIVWLEVPENSSSMTIHGETDDRKITAKIIITWNAENSSWAVKYVPELSQAVHWSNNYPPTKLRLREGVFFI